MAPLSMDGQSDRTLAAAHSFYQTQSFLSMATKRTRDGNPSSSSRTPSSASSNRCPRDHLEYYQRPESERGTYLYLGYGSNLSNETFRGKRGIKPLSQVNVQVPSLRLTFDLPGIPYKEPCFANSGNRDPESDRPTQDVGEDASSEKSPLLPQPTGGDKYRKDRWHKGLIGVVYEVTPEDYVHIIQTEGGGTSYQDITVDCHPLATNDPAEPVPQNPTSPTIKAHTLFAPARDPSDPPDDGRGRFQRPDPSYAQSSARYLKLMTDGASERGLPYEYQDYLHSLRPYTITTVQQRLGQFVFLALWGPFVALVFSLAKIYADDKGNLPEWLRMLTGAIFRAVWVSYDGFFKGIFGEGERTITDGDKDGSAGLPNRTGMGDTNIDATRRPKISDNEKV